MCVRRCHVSLRRENARQSCSSPGRKTERKFSSRELVFFERNNYAASGPEESRGYFMTILNSFCSRLLISRQKSANEVLSFRFTPSLSIICAGKMKRGRLETVSRKKFDLFKMGPEEREIF